MPIPSPNKPRKKSLFPRLALCSGLGLLALPAHSQPAPPRTEALVESVEQDWQNLRQTTGAQEFLDPQGTITRYQKFYETAGFRSGQTTVEITGIIAQLYWQGLHDSKKALSIYDWGLQNFVQYPLYSSLQKGRAAIAEAGNFVGTFAVSPVDITTSVTTANPNNKLQPVVIESPKKVLLPAAGDDGTKQVKADGDTKALSPITLNSGKTSEAAIAPTNNPFAPVTVTPSTSRKNGNLTVTPPSTVIPSSTVIPAHPHMGQAGIQSGGKSTYSAVTGINPDTQAGSKVLTPVQINPNNQSASKVLSPVQPTNPSLSQRPGDNAVLSPITPRAPSVQDDHAFSGINIRQLQLINAVVPIRQGKMSIETFLSHDKPTAQEALWLLSAHRVIVQWKADKPLRVALIGVIESQNPQLLQTPEKLPQPTQLALAEYYADQRNPKAADVYKILISEEFAPGTWFSKIYVMNNLADFYGAMGQYDKAALAKLAIQKQTTSENWVGNTYVEAARFYMQAGETEKAQALYAKAEKSPYAWASGMAFVDEGNTLINQGKYDDAIKVLSQSVKGTYADQIQVVLLSFLSYAHYLKGSFDLSKQYAQQSIALHKSLKNPLTGEGIEAYVNRASDILAWIEQWKKEPLVCTPRELRIVAHAGMPVERILTIRSQSKVPLTISCDNPKIIIRDEDKANQREHDFEKEVIIGIAPEQLTKSFDTVLTIRSTKYPDFPVNVPVHIEVTNFAS